MRRSPVSPDIRPDFRNNRFLQALAVVYAGVWIWAAIKPLYRFDWFLENLLTVVAAVVLVATYRRFPLSNLSYLLIFAFMVLHAIGAHYTYSEVPVGFTVQDSLDFARNHYDRLVHFSFGLLLAYPVREVLTRTVTDNAVAATLLTLAVVFSSSASFEIIEWIIALVVNPEAGAAYLGTQGDEFDAQKDMALAALGAVIALSAVAAAGLSKR